MEEYTIQVSGINKKFVIPHERINTLRERFIRIFRPQAFEIFKAIDNLSLEVAEGEFLGVIGANGSGKSTLLKIIAGILRVDSGRVIARGSISPFLELGVGFQPELSGRENVFLCGALLGLTRDQTRKKYNDIVRFAELERFMDQKLKNYSSGMQVRLAFAVITQVDTDNYLIDEVLAVGDLGFQKKCYDFFRSLKKRGKTIVFVSHDLQAVQEFCSRTALMQEGRIVAIGATKDVISLYRDSYQYQKTDYDVEEGAGPITIQKVRLVDENQKERWNFQRGDSLRVILDYVTKEEVIDPVFQVNIYNAEGVLCSGDNTERHGIKLGRVKGNGRISFISQTLNLLGGEYALQVRIWPAAFVGDPYHKLRSPINFSVTSDVRDGGGICYLTSDWYLEENKTA
ncbi:MAG: ABC transporter ATP-binding protein [Patescibacteria group bacterium]